MHHVDSHPQRFVILAFICIALASSQSFAQKPASGSKEPSRTSAVHAVVNVDGRSDWTATPVQLVRGHTYTLAGSGAIVYDAGGASATPAGRFDFNPCTPGQYHPGFVAPGLPCVSLLGKIGVLGAPFEVGPSLTMVAPASGQLFLGVNDVYFADNYGAWTVGITEDGYVETPAPTRLTPGQQIVVSVSAAQPWTDSGMVVEQNRIYRISGNGAIVYSRDGSSASPAGRFNWSPCGPGQYHPGFVSPELPCLSLLGRIGPLGPVFEIGPSLTLNPSFTGELYLGVNDTDYSDNYGAWIVTLIPLSQGVSSAPPSAPAQVQTVHENDTPEQVLAALGEPDKKVDVESKKIWVYKDLKVTFVNGKVAEVQ